MLYIYVCDWWVSVLVECNLGEYEGISIFKRVVWRMYMMESKYHWKEIHASHMHIVKKYMLLFNWNIKMR